MRPFLLMACAGLLLASCGSRAPAPAPNSERITMFSEGPINSACLAADRDAANRRLCGCIQTVANLTLSAGDQSRAVGFFANPHQAQEVRMSSDRADDRFWDRYRAFAARAERSCRGY